MTGTEKISAPVIKVPGIISVPQLAPLARISISVPVTWPVLVLCQPKTGVSYREMQ